MTADRGQTGGLSKRQISPSALLATVERPKSWTQG